MRKIADGVETIFVYNASGQLVAEYSTELPENPKVSYLTADHLGSPRIITDGIGMIVSRHDYLAFGDEVTNTVGQVGGRTAGWGYGEEDDIRKQYTGYERDKESGLDYAQARYYNSQQGRFTSVDPLTASADVRNPQTFNRYSYVLNSPYKFVDPLGLIPQDSGSGSYNSTGYCDASNSSCSGSGYDPFTEPPLETVEEVENQHEAAHAEAGEQPQQIAKEGEEPPPAASASPVEVVVWDGIWTPSVSWFGHVSYNIDGKAYSWEGGFTWEKHDRSDYEETGYTDNREEKNDGRATISAGVGYTLDFGTVTVGKGKNRRTLDLNKMFRDALINHNGRGYGARGNNCTAGFRRAINKISKYLKSTSFGFRGVAPPPFNEIRPSLVKGYIKSHLANYITKTRKIPYREPSNGESGK